MEKAELIIAALQERIGQLVSGYETQIALLRAEITELTNKVNELIDREKVKKDYNKSLDTKLEEV